VALEFFVIASEGWYFCNSFDLLLTTTNPFSSFKDRLRKYHIFVWSLALILTAFPFVIQQANQIYGFWFVSNQIDVAVCWLKISDAG
jgi:hypothetical protein